MHVAAGLHLGYVLNPVICDSSLLSKMNVVRKIKMEVRRSGRFKIHKFWWGGVGRHFRGQELVRRLAGENRVATGRNGASW